MGSEVLKSAGKSWEGMEGNERKPRYLKNLKLGAGEGEGKAGGGREQSPEEEEKR